jgi:hypothetical protein
MTVVLAHITGTELGTGAALFAGGIAAGLLLAGRWARLRRSR